MTDRLPPLTALRAFEAAARHLSFAKAASELNVTPAALSFQIKSLEEHLGQLVFRRLNRAVELTDVGRALYPGCAEGFDALGQAWRMARRYGDTSRLAITAGPAFTAKWLAPRLFDFAQKYPEIELRFSASLRIMDFDRDEVDVAIRFGLGGDDDLYSVPIIREWMTPMMTPELAKVYPSPDLMTSEVLLHQDDTRAFRPAMDWSAWRRAANLPQMEHHGPRFSQADHAIDAALEGAGIVLGRISLTQKALKEGRLVAPYKIALTTPAHYRFVCPHASIAQPKVKAFEDWITSETKTLSQWEGDRVFVAAS